LKDRVTNIREDSGREIRKDRKMVLREKRTKKEKIVKVQKIGVKNSGNSVEKKEKLLREVTVKIGLKQEDKKERIVIEVLLDSEAIGLVISSDFARKNKFKKKKLE